LLTHETCRQQFMDEFAFRLEDKTLDLHQKAVEQLLDYCGKLFNEITPKDIRKWVLYLETEGYKPVTIKTRLAGVKLFYRYCVEEQSIKESPAASVPFPFVEDSLPKYLEIEQLEQLRKLVEGKVRDRAIIELLYATGIRISELVQMKKEDIDWSERIIHIPRGKRKKGRIVLFTRNCGQYLQKYLDQRSDDLPYLFINNKRTNSICKRFIQYKFNDYKKELGFHVTPHTLRHTFAAHLAMKGMPLECIQVLLGHDTPHQTQVYARLYSHFRKQMYDQLM